MYLQTGLFILIYKHVNGEFFSTIKTFYLQVIWKQLVHLFIYNSFFALLQLILFLLHILIKICKFLSCVMNKTILF